MNNSTLSETTGLTFRRAWFNMLNGKKVKRKNWTGYWEFKDGTIMMHCKEGDVIDIRKTTNVAYTFTNIAENDWEVVE